MLIIIVIVELTIFYTSHYKTRIVKQAPHLVSLVTYPVNRTFYPRVRYTQNPDFAPLIFKEAVLSDAEGVIVFRNQRLNDMLALIKPGIAYMKALGVGGPLVYFTPKAKILPAGSSKELFINAAYTEHMINPENPHVLFSREDIDFSHVNNSAALKDTEIEYTKRDNPNELGIVVDAPADGFLIRTENFHSKWQAFVDGKKTPIYRANYAFQAIRIGEGRHKVSFRFFSIYPALLYIHIFCVFLNWLAFNVWLFHIHKKQDIG